MSNPIASSRGFIVRMSVFAALVLLSACAPAQETAWSSNNSNGNVAPMGPSASIGP